MSDGGISLEIRTARLWRGPAVFFGCRRLAGELPCGGCPLNLFPYGLS